MTFGGLHISLRVREPPPWKQMHVGGNSPSHAAGNIARLAGQKERPSLLFFALLCQFLKVKKLADWHPPSGQEDFVQAQVLFTCCFVHTSAFISRTIPYGGAILTPRLKCWMVPSNCREVIPDPLEHLLTLFNTDQVRRDHLREGRQLLFRQLFECFHVSCAEISFIFTKNQGGYIDHIFLPTLIMSMSPNLISVPCDSATALRCFNGIALVSKIPNGTLFAVAHLR